MSALRTVQLQRRSVLDLLTIGHTMITCSDLSIVIVLLVMSCIHGHFDSNADTALTCQFQSALITQTCQKYHIYPHLSMLGNKHLLSLQ